MAFANTSFDELVATTIKNYRKRMTDNITNKEVFLYHLNRGGFVEEREGGTSIVEGLIHADNSTVDSYSGYDELDISPQEGISAAEYDWKFVSGAVSISGEQLFKNSGAQKQVDLLDTKITQLELSLMKEMDLQVLSDGSGGGGKDIVGLQAAVHNGVTGTYAGIVSGTFTFWLNQYIDLTSASFAAVGVDNMRTLFHNCSRMGEKPDLILTTQTIFERYEKTLVSNERYTNMNLGDSGFKALEYKGIPMVFDVNVESGFLYMLNSQHLRFIYGKGRNFELSPFQSPINGDFKVAHCIVRCALTTKRRASQGVIDGLDNA